jgi:hypothetical protein
MPTDKTLDLLEEYRFKGEGEPTDNDYISVGSDHEASVVIVGVLREITQGKGLITLIFNPFLDNLGKDNYDVVRKKTSVEYPLHIAINVKPLTPEKFKVYTGEKSVGFNKK